VLAFVAGVAFVADVVFVAGEVGEAFGQFVACLELVVAKVEVLFECGQVVACLQLVVAKVETVFEQLVLQVAIEISNALGLTTKTDPVTLLS